MTMAAPIAPSTAQPRVENSAHSHSIGAAREMLSHVRSWRGGNDE